MVKLNTCVSPSFIAAIKIARKKNKCWFCGKRKYKSRILRVTRIKIALIPLCCICWREYK